jgi:hypothetical protein
MLATSSCPWTSQAFLTKLQSSFCDHQTTLPKRVRIAVAIYRSIVRFEAIYGGMTPQMRGVKEELVLQLIPINLGSASGSGRLRDDGDAALRQASEEQAGC